MTDKVIHVENLGKKYRIGHVRERYRTLREALIDTAKSPIRRLRSFGQSSHQAEDTIWALNGVSFEVKRGEVLGIIGRNGSGKSTLLKILTRITDPTTGRAELNGRVGSLLEVGTGFHPELTGRENTYLSGAILGMARKEIDRKFDEIVDFSGVEQFIDTPVKRYSSGMKVRLGFAVAAHLEPEILLIDEVLAVGDTEFQRKCLAKMKDVASAGRTVLLVSHNMGSIRRLCQKALLLDSGRVVGFGDANEVVDQYLDDVVGGQADIIFKKDQSKEMQIRRIRILDEQGAQTAVLNRVKLFRIEICYDVRVPIPDAYVVFDLRSAEGIRICHSLDSDLVELGGVRRESGSYVAVVEFPGGVLNYGAYTVTVALASRPSAVHDVCSAVTFSLSDPGSFASTRTTHGGIVLAMPLKWETRRY